MENNFDEIEELKDPNSNLFGRALNTILKNVPSEDAADVAVVGLTGAGLILLAERFFKRKNK